MKRGTQGLSKNSNQNSSGAQKSKLPQQKNQQVKPNTLKKPTAQLMPQRKLQPTLLVIKNLEFKNKINIQKPQNNLMLQKNNQAIAKGANQNPKQPQKQQTNNQKVSQQLLNQNMILKYEKLTKQFNTVKLLYLRKVLSQKIAKNKTAQLFSNLPLLMSKYEIFPNFGLIDIPNKWSLKPGQKLSLLNEERKDSDDLDLYYIMPLTMKE